MSEIKNKSRLDNMICGVSIGRKVEDNSPVLLDNLIWMTTKEAAVYLRKSVGSIHTLVSRRKLRARKFMNRLYFKKDELNYLLETSKFIGG